MSNRTSQKNAAASESNELVSAETNNALPAFMQADAAAKAGKENIDIADMIVPRMALMQALNEQVEQGLVSPGNFFHTILEESFGSELDDLVIYHHSKRYVLWSPRHMGGGILARASDGKHWDPQFIGQSFTVKPSKDRPRYEVQWEIKDAAVGRDVGLGAWGTSDPENPDSPPAATLTHVLVCGLLSRPDIGPFTILLQRTAERVAKDLLTKINLDSAPIFGQIFKMSVKTDTGPSGDFYNYKFAKNGHIATLEEYEAAKRWNEVFTVHGVKTDEGEAEGAASRGGAADDGGKDY